MTNHFEVKRISIEQRDLLLVFVKSQPILEAVVPESWQELAERLNNAPGTAFSVEEWMEFLLGWKTQALDCKMRLSVQGQEYASDEEAPIPSLSDEDVFLLEALGEIQAEEPSNFEHWSEPVRWFQEGNAGSESELVERLLRAHVRDNKSTAQLCDKLRHVLDHLNRVLTTLAERSAPPTVHQPSIPRSRSPGPILLPGRRSNGTDERERSIPTDYLAFPHLLPNQGLNRDQAAGKQN